MASVNQITTGLSNLSAESKRRHADIKANCDTSLANLKQYAPTTSISDIRPSHRNDLIVPFVKAVKTGNAKIATISIPVIHQLIVSRSVPPQQLDGLLAGLKEASNLAVDIQLRILQCLPTLMQTYGPYIKGETLVSLLRICSSLTTSNKATVVINTASATLQQVFSNVYDDERGVEDGHTSSGATHSVSIGEDSTIEVSEIAYESFQIFQDLCHLIENEEPTYLKDFSHIKTTSILEIVENVIASHKPLFNKSEELSHLLRVKLIPSLLRILSSTTKSFPLVTRTMRVILVLLSSQLDNLEIESEVILSFLNHILLNEPTEEETVPWEKILVLELYKGLFADFSVIKSIFEKYDNDDKKKDVIQELNNILITYLQNNTILTPNQSLKQPHGQLYLSKGTSHMKISILDHLDKTEPPHSIPATYPIYLTFNILLLYSEGIANFVQNLTNNSDSSTLEADVEFTNFFIEASYPNVSVLFDLFIYYDMDNELFHLLVRSLQRFTHSTGLLGLGELRDGLLMIISKAIIKNEEIREKENSNSLQEQGKQLLAFGESLVESLTSLQTPSQEDHHNTGHLDGQNAPSLRQSMESSHVRIRNFNSRHITCIRALANLGVSLGSTLGTSWKIIWMTFQWCEYFVYGPDNFNGKKSKGHDEFVSKLTSQDYANLEASKRKLTESINDFPVQSFVELLQSLIELSDDVLGDRKKSVDQDAVLVPCPFNTSFFLGNIIKICQVNPNRFLITDDTIWQMWCDYIVRLGTQRSMNYNMRIHIVKEFKFLIKHIADQGFSTNIADIMSKTASKSLNGIKNFLNAVLDLGAPKELLVLNCETEIHHLCLSTLYELIDKYEAHYKNSWNIVFEILDTPFKTTSWFNEDKNLREKVRALIDSSFRTLKLILDEFMSTLPYSQLKLLIDTLHNFCSQTFDLNTSFSSVSYFWLISDSLKSRISENRKNESLQNEGLAKIGTETELVTFIDNATSEDIQNNHIYYIALDIYLLSTLAKLSSDQRDQVRDGSIQTFFQIIDVHGTYLSSSATWDLVYKVVFQPVLFDLKVDLSDSKYHKKEWLESFGLTLSGLVSVFNKFMMDFDSVGHIFDKWKMLIAYLDQLLSFKWLLLHMLVFRSFQDLLAPFSSKGISKESSLRELDAIKKLLFEFWVHVPVEYDFVNPQQQDSAAALMECFPSLYKIVKDGLTEGDIKTSIALINKCARYPLLPEGNQLDNKRPTKLQKSTIDNLKIIDLTDRAVLSQVIQQLSGMIVYPFGVRKRIASKLEGNSAITSKYKVPSFIAISHLSTHLLREKVEKLDDFSVLLEDKGAAKVLRSLIEVIGNKSDGVAKESKKLWVEASEILILMVRRIVADDTQAVTDEDLWKVIMRSVVLCLEEDRTGLEGEELAEAELLQTNQYSQLVDVVLPRLLASGNTELVDEYLKSLYENSFLYSFDDVDQEVVQGLGGPENYVGDELVERLTAFDFESTFGSTKPIQKFANQHTRMRCLEELVHYSVSPVEHHLNTVSQKYLVCRASFCLRRFISEERLLFSCPLSKLQEREVVTVLRGINTIEWTAENRQNAGHIRRLLVKSVLYSGRVPGLNGLVEIALSRS